MPETYNPQERSFIRRPEPKICITCGQPIAPDVKPLSNEMNTYINPISRSVVTINSAENVLEVQGVKIYKVTGKDGDGKPVSKYIPQPQAENLVPSQPVKPIVAAPAQPIKPQPAK